MEQDKFSKLIKDIRQKHNLTQKQLAEKYNVSYQAVSKWENGLNMPDISLLKEICKDFNISLDEILGNNKKKKNTKLIIVLLGIFIIVLLLIIFLTNNDFQFNTLQTECENFKISGNISYNQNKAAIYISDIEYCGENDNTIYKNIECILYEKNKNVETKISEYKSIKENIKLDNFLNDAKLIVDNYETTCKKYDLYLLINAYTNDDKIINYKIPLKLNNCNKLN